jgi:hypothetical protein
MQREREKKRTLCSRLRCEDNETNRRVCSFSLSLSRVFPASSRRRTRREKVKERKKEGEILSAAITRDAHTHAKRAILQSARAVERVQITKKNTHDFIRRQHAKLNGFHPLQFRGRVREAVQNAHFFCVCFISDLCPREEERRRTTSDDSVEGKSSFRQKRATETLKQFSR